MVRAEKIWQDFRQKIMEIPWNRSPINETSSTLYGNPSRPKGKVLEIKEAYFPTDVDSIVEETLVMEGTGTYEDESSETVLDPTIARYSSAISKLKPLG